MIEFKNKISNEAQPTIVNPMLPAGRCCLVCSKLNCSPHPLPDMLFEYNCDLKHFIGVGNEEQFNELKKETICSDFSPCR